MTDPFKLTEQTCISFSGGRTSAYMLYRVLESNNGELLHDSKVCFANTGKECEETLEFIQACSDNWSVPITWIEYRAHEKPKQRFKVVDFQTASRNGEPFEAMIKQEKYLPNPVTRICTARLKIRTMHNYLTSIGIEQSEDTLEWIGIRRDEPKRAAKFDQSRIPLFVAGITKTDIGNFWKNNSFDLKLPNYDGVTYHGNCDLCFLKATNIVFSLIQEKPERADWWIKQEKSLQTSNEIISKDGAKFRKDRPSYEQMKNYALDQDDLFGYDESIPCYCGD